MPAAHEVDQGAQVVAPGGEYVPAAHGVQPVPVPSVSQPSTLVVPAAQSAAGFTHVAAASVAALKRRAARCSILVCGGKETE